MKDGALKRFRIERALLAGTICAMLPGAGAVAAPPGYPNKPIRIVVAYTPAGTTDILARAIGQKMTESWG